MFGMRPFSLLPRSVQVLLIINTVVFLLTLGGGELRGRVLLYGALIPEFFVQAWRFVTYMFIHGGFWHFIFNMMVLWMFGSEIAENMGDRRFLGLYFFSGIFAGLFSIPFYLFGALSPFSLIVGASGALMGIFVAYYKFFPNRMLLLFFFIPMRMKTAIWVLVIFDILLSHTNDSVAHFTHLGGILAGFIFMELFYGRGRLREWCDGLRNRRARRQRGDGEAIEGEVSFLDPEKQLDMILKKVEEEGLQALSEAERNYLLKAGERLRARRRR